MAQGPPMFQTSRDQRYAQEDDDADFFASLRPDKSDDSSSGEYPRYEERYEERFEEDEPPVAQHARYEESRHSARIPEPIDPWSDQPDDRTGDVREIPEIDDRRPPTWDSYIDGDDDPYRRSDILVESQTAPTGGKAAGPAQPPIPDDRPPAEAVSGNRLLTVLLFFSGLATSVALWLFDTQAGAVNDSATLMLAAGRVTGLVGEYLLFVQLLMMSRVSWLEEWVGARDLLRWHRWLGTTLVVFVLAHIVFIVYGYAMAAETGVVDQAWTIVTTLPEMLSAVVATGILVVLSLISIRFARTRLPYELWHLIHLSAYLVLLLG